jgi:hypothetical protein
LISIDEATSAIISSFEIEDTDPSSFYLQYYDEKTQDWKELVNITTLKLESPKIKIARKGIPSTTQGERYFEIFLRHLIPGNSYSEFDKVDTKELIERGKVIGKGTFGTGTNTERNFPDISVYICQIEGHRKFALKVIPKSKTLPSVEEELKILSKLKHNNICPLVGYKQVSEDIFVLMPLFDSSLKKIISDKKDRKTLNITSWFTEKQIIFICVQVAKGLEYLHSHNMSHKDLKVTLYALSLQL